MRWSQGSKVQQESEPQWVCTFQVSGLCLLLSCWPTQSQCGEGLPKGMNVGKWEQIGVIYCTIYRGVEFVHGCYLVSVPTF